MKLFFRRPLSVWNVSAAAALAWMLISLPTVRAADPYDANLEKRIEALERELNVMEGDSKGKDVQADATTVPTFLRAAGVNVQELTISAICVSATGFRTRISSIPARAMLNKPARICTGCG